MAQEPRVLVLAGAGSGKTRTLVERVAHLIEHGASGYEIACTTFTRAAAGEMRKRLESRIGPEAHKVALSTFHGLGLGLLQKYGHHIGLRYGRLTVFSPLEADMLRQHCAERIGLYAKRKWRIPKREVEREWARLELSDSRPPDTPTGKLYAMFQAACLTHNAVPYSGLVSGLLDLAKLGKIREFTNWKYFLVDEVQDLDPLQWRTLEAMLGNREDSELFAVGDISQSIYGFRGAVPDYLQQLIDEGRLSLYALRSNYRSQGDIVDAANCLIRHNTSHRVIEMRAQRTEHGAEAVEKLSGVDSAGLAEYLARQAADVPPVILCRSNRMLDKLCEELTLRGIAHKRIGKRTSILQSPLFVKANAILKCVVNPADEMAFLLAHPGLGVSAERYNEIRIEAAGQDRSCFSVYLEHLDPATHLAMLKESSTVADAADWFSTWGVSSFDPADGDGQTYIDWLKTYAAAHPDDLLCEYLDWIALADVQDEAVEKDDAPCIRLMTCHASKGLEFPHVIIAGCNEGIMPSQQAVRAEGEAVEDERRLMYVAVTRAMDKLTLAIRPEKHPGETPSRFITEMDG